MDLDTMMNLVSFLWSMFQIIEKLAGKILKKKRFQKKRKKRKSQKRK